MKRYIGDGVYCEFDGGRYHLYTWDGLNVLNDIYLEIPEMKHLLDFVNQSCELTKWR